MWYTSSASCVWTLSALPPFPAWLGHKLLKTTAKPSHSPIHRVFSVNQVSVHLLPQSYWGWWAERRGVAQFPRSLVGFGAKLCSLACHSLETGLDAGDRAAGVARFTLQEIEASVLLQDGLWGAAGVTSHVFFCRGNNTVISSDVHRAKNEKTGDRWCLHVKKIFQFRIESLWGLNTFLPWIIKKLQIINTPCHK